MKNLFDQKTKEEIFSRIDKLTPQAEAQWGKMNVNQSLRHMTMALDIPTGKMDPTPDKLPPIPKWLLKFFLVNVKPPKAKAQTFKEMNTVTNGINPSDFKVEQAALKNAVEIFFNATSLLSENKVAGNFSRADWGKMFYNHTDHHLRQFGA